MATDPTTNVVKSPRGWPLFVAGLLLFVLGPISYGVQMGALHQTTMPWAMLALVSLGTVLMAASLWVRFGILRTIATVLFLGFTGFLFVFLFVLAKTPPYNGPAQVASKLPAFETTLASGQSFSNSDLAKENTIFLFFRGHW